MKPLLCCWSELCGARVTSSGHLIHIKWWKQLWEPARKIHWLKGFFHALVIHYCIELSPAPLTRFLQVFLCIVENIFLCIVDNIFLSFQRSEECDQAGGVHHDRGLQQLSETLCITSDITPDTSRDETLVVTVWQCYQCHRMQQHTKIHSENNLSSTLIHLSPGPGSRKHKNWGVSVSPGVKQLMMW